MTHVVSKDEAVYASTAIHMATGGDWISPKFLGRYAFYQPPLLFWVSGLSARLLGVSLTSLRLPSLIAAALICTLVFVWLWRFQTPLAACAGLLLMLSNRLLHTMSRLTMTDALLVLWFTAAMLVIAFDPGLRRRESAWAFGALAGLAILTKGVAGVLPLLALVVYWIIAPSRDRPRFRRVAVSFLAATVVALPWHLYQIVVHTKWFWKEYVVTKHLVFSIGSPEPRLQESQPEFYLRRLWRMDPVLCVGTFLALPVWIWAIKERVSARASALGAWCLVTAGALLLFESRGAWYLLPLIPALALASAEFFPFHTRAPRTIAVLLLAGLFCAKVYKGQETWGLSFIPDAPLVAAPALEQYCARHRSNELILVQPDDEFYASDLALPHVRYCYLQSRPVRRHYAIDFEYLGITVTAPEFNELASGWRDVYRQRLHEWGLNSEEPIATVILARTPDEVEEMIAAHPESDYSLPEEWQLHWPPTHTAWHAPGGRLYLLAKKTSTAPQRPGWPCHL
ncbi:MAG TPA: glycosyltransferase family 39 protein [Bryobacteraceae bacterium]|nr:glycosyltransferase family 39 protein [Bryobacteraceae bacterium]